MYNGVQIVQKHANNDNFQCFGDKVWEIGPKN